VLHKLGLGLDLSTVLASLAFVLMFDIFRKNVQDPSGMFGAIDKLSSRQYRLYSRNFNKKIEEIDRRLRRELQDMVKT
jgi:hypothetical protein